MTHILKVRNVNQAFVEGMWWLKVAGLRETSRNGTVVVAPGPVLTEYSHPTERILWHPKRDANPVFHLLESLWMLAGRNDVATLLPFNANMGNYAEPDGYIHGAYGRRWRGHFLVDQLYAIIQMLERDKDSRRAVLAMWDANVDLAADKRDLPCNTHAYFDLRDGVLNMTVCCRSNDMVWGAYGANAVHFSILQEVLAHALGAPVGVYRQFSNNFHIYINNPQARELFDTIEATPAPDPDLAPTPLILPGETFQQFMRDCQRMWTHPDERKETVFFRKVVMPLHAVYLARKAGRPWALETTPVTEWSEAFQQWAYRRDCK